MYEVRDVGDELPYMEISLLFDLVLFVGSTYDLKWECSTLLCWVMPWLTVNE